MILSPWQNTNSERFIIMGDTLFLQFYKEKIGVKSSFLTYIIEETGVSQASRRVAQKIEKDKKLIKKKLIVLRMKT